jgi:type I restriction enzyme S subunit
MEKTAGDVMVRDYLQWASISIKEIIENDFRLEASVYNITARLAKKKISDCRYEKLFLKDVSNKIYYGGRAKRCYVKLTHKKAIGFLGSSEMLELNPKPTNFLSSERMKIDDFKVEKNTILISRSGTIGNLTFVNETLSKFLVSEHAIRIVAKEYPGYLYAYLKSETGQQLIQSLIYGSVVSQIEPEHLEKIIIPNPPNEIKQEINNKILQSFELRDQTNELINNAEKMLLDELQLPSTEELENIAYQNEYNNLFKGMSDVPKYKNVGLKFSSVPIKEIRGRLDSSFHIATINQLLSMLKQNALLTTLSDKNICKEIILPGRFKRYYVEKDYGTVFLGGKQIYELDPANKKYLSVSKHSGRITKELFLKENMIVITCSGTIGKVNIVPKHWKNWAMSQHVLRVVPTGNHIAGYIYIWLNTEYGKELITRHTYGSVVDEIDNRHLSQVEIPILHDTEKQNGINDLVLKANKIRTQAFEKEQQGIKLMNDLVINAE